MKHDVKDFQHDVIERSKTVPVLVDFWAEWCGPCRVLGPVLERLAGKAGGEWELKKLDTEEFPSIAAEYRIYSIPNVKLFVNGEVADEFVGALPEARIEQWLRKVLPDKHESTLAKVEGLLTSLEYGKAASILEVVHAKAPDHEHARTLLACALLFSNPERATALVEGIETGNDGERADAIRVLHRLIASVSDLPEAPVKQQYLSAIDALRDQKFDAALEHFIDVLRRDRSYDDDGSRKACIAIFKFLGEEHEITQRHRLDFNRAF